MRLTSFRVSSAGLLLVLLCSGTLLGQAGKIAGRVVDDTGQPLPGTNVLLVGTLLGSVADVDGYYTILNVSPGQHTLRASIIGFAAQVVEGVRVRIDQTTTINFELSEEAVGMDEVVITATPPVVQPDVSNSQMNVSSEEIEMLPVSSVESVVGLQAGVQGLEIRGSSENEISFMVNGMTLRDERNNTPYSNISLSSIQEVQVQTGGFNAEYGNVRSGIINVITKEGSRDRYNADVIVRYSPPTQKHFGDQADDPNSYWMRPFLDPDVAWTGTESGAWDAATQRQYPTFEGWVATSEKLLQDDDPSNDMTAEALQQAFLWQRRKVMEVTKPDYNVDVGLGGPVPLVGKALGNMRFYASFRRDEELYLIPLHTDRFEQWTGHVKLTSNISPKMKLTLEGLSGNSSGTASLRTGAPGIFRSASSIADVLSEVSFIDTRIYSTDYWTPSSVKTLMGGAKFTHLLNESAFYEVRFTAFDSKYDTNPGRLRDETPIAFFGGVGFDEGPFGFQPKPSFGVDGARSGVGMSNSRDSSRVTTYQLQADYTSQVNRFLQIKTGLEYNLADTRVNYAQFDVFLRSGNSNSRWEESPSRAALYGQGKIEFQGMVANLGLRLDYSGPGGEWIVYDPYTPAFSAALSGGIDTLLTTEPIEAQVSLSPRLGVSFPVTESSKLFFNYGHFRSMPDPNNLYLLRQFAQTGQVSRVADPNGPLPKTVAYELGYEQALFSRYLLRVAGYYKDIALQPFLVEYLSRDGQVNYDVTEPQSFEDIRGFELTLAKTTGRWFRGFVNYTYMVFTEGNFGLARNFENPTAQRAFSDSDAERRDASSKPVPRPYGRLNLDFLTPPDAGPELGGLRPLGDWTFSLITRWRKGAGFTWTGGGSVPGVLNNVSRTDSWSSDLRITKNLQVVGRRAQIFLDVFNVFNRRQLSFNGFVNGNDENAYLRSIHLPESADYSTNIPGGDKVGTFRDYAVAYHPMERITNRENITNPDEAVIYWEFDSRSYIEYADGDWVNANQGEVDQVLADKAYIDMPNQSFLTFTGPRDFYFGIRISI